MSDKSEYVELCRAPTAAEGRVRGKVFTRGGCRACALVVGAHIANGFGTRSRSLRTGLLASEWYELHRHAHGLPAIDETTIGDTDG